MLIAINMILGLRGAMDLVAAIGLLLHEFDGKLFREKELPGVGRVSGLISLLRSAAAHANFEMDVVCAAHVITGEYGLECHSTTRIRELNTSQEGERVGWMILRRRSHHFRWRASGRGSAGTHRILLREARVQTERITMPYINSRVRQWLAAPAVHYDDPERQRDARFSLDDIGPEKLVGNIERSLFLLGVKLANLCSGRQTESLRGEL